MLVTYNVSERSQKVYIFNFGSGIHLLVKLGLYRNNT